MTETTETVKTETNMKHKFEFIEYACKHTADYFCQVQDNVKINLTFVTPSHIAIERDFGIDTVYENTNIVNVFVYKPEYGLSLEQQNKLFTDICNLDDYTDDAIKGLGFVHDARYEY